MRAILGRELKSLYCSLAGWAYSAVFLLAAGYCFVSGNLATGSGSLLPAFSKLGIALIPLSALLTMRAFFTDMREGGQIQMLLGNAGVFSMVMGKFFAILLGALVPCLVTFFYAGFIAVFGVLFLPETLLAYLGFFLLCCATLSVGLFFSALCVKPFPAYLLSSGLLLLLWLFDNAADQITTPLLHSALTVLSPFSYSQAFSEGILSLCSVVYLLAFSVLFLFLTDRTLRFRLEGRGL